MKLQLQLFTATSEIQDKFHLNFTATIETFVWTIKQVWYYDDGIMMIITHNYF